MKASIINSNSENEKLIRKLYAVAESQDVKAFTALFTQDGYFTTSQPELNTLVKILEKRWMYMPLLFRICIENYTSFMCWMMKIR